MCLCRLLKNYKHVVTALMTFLMVCRRAFVNWDGINCKQLPTGSARHPSTLVCSRIEPNRVIYSAGHEPRCYYMLLVGCG